MDIELLKKLREKTGAGIMECQRALLESKGDFNKAVQILKEKGLEIVLRKAPHEVKEGRIEAYIHLEGKIGVLVEINCETDFVARNELFKKFCHDISMQIAATNPTYIKAEDIPQEIIEKEEMAFKEILENKSREDYIEAWQLHLAKFRERVCLLEQPFIRDEKLTIKEYLGSLTAQFGENIQIRRFMRYQLGE